MELNHYARKLQKKEKQLERKKNRNEKSKYKNLTKDEEKYLEYMYLMGGENFWK